MTTPLPFYLIQHAICGTKQMKWYRFKLQLYVCVYTYIYVSTQTRRNLICPSIQCIQNEANKPRAAIKSSTIPLNVVESAEILPGM